MGIYECRSGDERLSAPEAFAAEVETIEAVNVEVETTGG